jgi:uncharacterized protein YqgV (UPF0045/DUF77 family)
MEHKINLALQVIPKSKKHDTYDLVDKAIRIIQNSGLKYQVCPFETVMEGDYSSVMKVVEHAQDACLRAGAEELLVNIKIQIKKGSDVTMEEKTAKYN